VTGPPTRCPLWTATAGDGPGDIVLVHGALDRSAGMLKLSRRLDTHWRVTRYDRRGYGRSTPSDGPFTLDTQIADLVSVIAALRGLDTPAAPALDHRGHRSSGVAPDRGGHRSSSGVPAAQPPPRCIETTRATDGVVLFGHSFGGNVALGVADRHPELVRAVVIYESPLSWMDWWPSDSAGGAAARVGGDDAGAAAEAFMRRLIGDRRWDRLPNSTRAARRAEGPAMLGELADLRRAAPWRPERIGVPVLTMFGEHGRPHHRRAMEWVAGVVPDGRSQMVPGAHHFGPSTHAGVVAELITGFLASSPAG